MQGPLTRRLSSWEQAGPLQMCHAAQARLSGRRPRPGWATHRLLHAGGVHLTLFCGYGPTVAGPLERRPRS
ncbi:hypothetical protein NDU88_005182 [Pleurodeles waltl]|uniref:Uncharacterized protein n=1 Tax=Pleurodeles waltl TaxID=8319 RepID=A0AAV7PHB1_PLEWA|nr:hypothetical protein NDU88_005182 [Pleurodeles waltl]